MKLEPRELIKRLTIAPDALKTLGWLCVILVLLFVSFWGIPMLIVHMWNDFFHAMFGWPKFYYFNGLALICWVLLCIGIFALLKEVE